MKPPDRRLPGANIFFPVVPRRRATRLVRLADSILKRVGSTWRASPIRRIIQSACLLLFLLLFFYISWPYAEVFSYEAFARKQAVPVELFLMIDPLVGVSTAVAARVWNPAVLPAIAILVVCLFIPRAFCGYLCPLGTLIDVFDWLIGRHFRRLHLPSVGWWVHTKYYLLAGVLFASAFGVLVSGYVAAIPVVTRGMLMSVAPIQVLLLRGENQVRPLGFGDAVSLVLFAAVFLLSLFGKRFWCRYVCPSGALFSACNLGRLSERKVEDTCIRCNKCVEICPFDAIQEDFTTRGLDCTWCQSCGGVCPSHSIKFVWRIGSDRLKLAGDPPVVERKTSRRGFIGSLVGGAAAALAVPRIAQPSQGDSPLRPPGSVSEREFLDLCIRCGQCFQACPGPVLHPAGSEWSLDSLWTPVAVPTHAGCHQDCNFCTQVCPTGAIRPLSLDEKRKTRMGLAVINTETCLPHAGIEDCRLCVDECDAAGYHAIEMRRVQLDIPDDIPPGMFSEMELEEMSQIDAPFVVADACVGCGLCEYRCHTALVKQQKQLDASAIVVVPENADRPEAR